MGPELASLRSFQILFGSNLKVVNIAEVSFTRGDDGSVCWIFFFLKRGRNQVYLAFV